MKKHLRTLLKDGRTAVSASAASFPEKLVADERAAITIVAALALPAVILETAVWFWREGENRAFSRA